MMKKIAVVLSTVTLAFIILSISVLRSSIIRPSIDVYSATPKPELKADTQEKKIEIMYVMPFPGRILPDSPFWPIKALRDKLWMGVTTNPMRKAELSLLFADKRLMASYELFRINKPLLALSTLTKAGKYLEEGGVIEKNERQRGLDTKSFLFTLATASLKHREVIEEMLNIVPDDVKPEVIKAEDYSRNVYKQCRDALQSQGVSAPENPFDTN
ncbi:MAG: DUF5667 domain-containing protein [Candidatus Woesebacteria bacterium]|nr:DUF5667 domain-containing protein [Candidatus Woesebacteria bacterium]